MRVLVICSRVYNPAEFWAGLGTLKKRGHTYDVASTGTTIESEGDKKKRRIRYTIADLMDMDLSSYDGLMIISGDMKFTKANWTDDRFDTIVDAFNDPNKPIAAICGAVPIIRHAARGKKVSFFPLVKAKTLLQDAGAILNPVAVTRDQNLVTAEHSMASEMWAEEFCNLLEGKPTQYQFYQSDFVPKGSPRKPIPEVARLQEALKNAQGLRREEVDADEED